MIDKLIERSARTPYFHLHHADGAPYMRRFWLMPESRLEKFVYEGSDPKAQQFYYELHKHERHRCAARLHNIQTPDYDREMHNHPWSFISIVLRGGYVEARPIGKYPIFTRSREEVCETSVRRVGSIAFRSYNDRHRILSVLPDTWTLILTGPKRQSWGFFTADGFVNWREFESVHNTRAVA